MSAQPIKIAGRDALTPARKPEDFFGNEPILRLNQVHQIKQCWAVGVRGRMWPRLEARASKEARAPHQEVFKTTGANALCGPTSISKQCGCCGSARIKTPAAVSRPGALLEFQFPNYGDSTTVSNPFSTPNYGTYMPNALHLAPVPKR
jgi:hypothetical protein